MVEPAALLVLVTATSSPRQTVPTLFHVWLKDSPAVRSEPPAMDWAAVKAFAVPSNAAVPVAGTVRVKPPSPMVPPPVIERLVARVVATPVPSPLTPVEIGSPVQLVKTPLRGVPRAPPLVTNPPNVLAAIPSAVKTPAPVVMARGAAPAPPPMTKELRAKTPELAHVEADEKYGQVLVF